MRISYKKKPVAPMSGSVRSLIAMMAMLLMVSGCVMNRKTSLPTPALSSPAALAFSVDQELRTQLSTDAANALSAAESQALNFGQPGVAISWKGNQADQTGVVTAYQPFRIGSSNCRRFEHNIRAGAVQLKPSGTACRTDNDVWTLVE